MKKEFTDKSEASRFVEQLYKDGRYHLSADYLTNGNYEVSWIEKKEYKAFDGTTQTDECWIKQDGTMLNVQDIELEHARNIIRMMVAEDRKAREMALEVVRQVRAQALEDASAWEGHTDMGKDDSDIPPTLH